MFALAIVMISMGATGAYLLGEVEAAGEMLVVSALWFGIGSLILSVAALWKNGKGIYDWWQERKEAKEGIDTL